MNTSERKERNDGTIIKSVKKKNKSKNTNDPKVTMNYHINIKRLYFSPQNQNISVGSHLNICGSFNENMS